MSGDRDTVGVPGGPEDEPTEDAPSEDGPAGSLAQLFAAISDLWNVDVDGTEMALRFDP
jgi:hypothetical protein